MDQQKCKKTIKVVANCHKIAKSIDIFIEISLVKKTVSKALNKKKHQITFESSK